MLSVPVGALETHVLSDGRFRLDGGAMFGVVPKALWERELPADDRNRVSLGLNCLLVRAADGTLVLGDTGLGARWSEREADRLGIERAHARGHAGGPATGLETELAALGVAPADVDVVVFSHLHFDHAGGAVRVGPGGGMTPTFPNARHVVQEAELREARAPHVRSRGSYREDDWRPLLDAGLLDTVEGPAELAPGVRVEPAPGHCPGLQVLMVESEGATLAFPSDLAPTRAHLRAAWGMGFDLEPAVADESKRAFLERAVAGGWLVVFDHDPEVAVARLVERERGGRTVIEAEAVAQEEAEAVTAVGEAAAEAAPPPPRSNDQRRRAVRETRA